MKNISIVLSILSPILISIGSGYLSRRYGINPGNLGTGIILWVIMFFGPIFVGTIGLLLTLVIERTKLLNTKYYDYIYISCYVLPAVVVAIPALYAAGF